MQFHLVSALCLVWIVIADGVRSFNYSNGIELSCYRAKLPHHLDFCNMVDWAVARAFPTERFSVYEPMGEISVKEQDDYAKYMYNRHSLRNQPSICQSAMKRFYCSQVFPECINSGDTTSSNSYLPTCKNQCLQMNSCSFDLDCSSLATSNCQVLVPSGYFILDQERGPYTPLPKFYLAVLVFWVLLACVWNFIAYFMCKGPGVLLHRAAAALPILKILCVGAGLGFWFTCIERGVCAYWILDAFIYTNITFDTALMCFLFFLANGWPVRSISLSINKNKCVSIAVCMFFIANIVVFHVALLLSRLEFWIANIVIYGVMYVFILASVVEQIKWIRFQVYSLSSTASLETDGGSANNKPVIRMYMLFLVLVLALMGTEVLTHSLMLTDARIWVSLAFYEISLLFLVMLIVVNLAAARTKPVVAKQVLAN